jgi:hypothetical protein
MSESNGGPRGRPVKPTALKALHGDFKHDPQRRNKNEPMFRGQVTAPNSLTPQARIMGLPGPDAERCRGADPAGRSVVLRIL